MDAFNLLAELSRQGREADIFTVVTAPHDQQHNIGKMLVVIRGQETTDLLIDHTVTDAVMAALHATHWQHPILLEFGDPDYRIFWDRLRFRSNVLVLGAGHISQPLVEMLALVEFSVTVVDDRPDFANKARFPKADMVVCNDFTKVLQDLDAQRFAAIIIVTRGHRYDVDCLRLVIDKPVQYIGMIGSQRRVKSIREMMGEEGVVLSELAKLKAPIGIDIGGQTPAEIALSIVAEVIGTLRGGTYLPLSAKRGDSHG